PLEVLIPAIPKDYSMLPAVIKSVREQVRHPIGDIFLVAPDSPEIRLIAETHACLFCDESRQLPIEKSDSDYTWREIDRSGWLFQQLLKLSGDQLGSHEHFLVVDADTCFLRPHVFIKGKKTLFLFSDPYRTPYYVVFAKLLGEKTTSCV